MRRVSLLVGVMVLAVVVTAGAQQQPPQPPARSGPLPSIEDRTTGLRKIDGYFPLYWDERAGVMLLEVPRVDTEFLLSTGLSAGLGSNDLGLDRGQGGQGRIVTFQRVGPRLLLVQPNQSFRSSSSNPLERRSVADSFAKSVLWGFALAAESNGRLLVDATDFFLRDVHGAAGGLRPGTFRVDKSRSAFYLPNTKGFPKNTEVDMTLTFVNEAVNPRGGLGPTQGPAQIGATGGGGFGGNLFSGTVASVTPTADAVTLREHMSFVELPDGNYTPRNDDPRAGFGGLTFVDFSQPIGEPIQFRHLRRHRLVKKDPGAAVSEPVEPIRYWVDPGAPEDVQKALIEGAMWWNQAFEAAGFRNAFRVELLPGDADPMDIRYNMINWVHRSTRGWSSGGSVADPRTGEILKATVTLGSLRDRQDYLIFEGLLSPYETGGEKPSILYETAIARIRQLSAHEVGHTLGLGHNYYDSTKGWISVMDYPHPLEELKADGTIDLSKAYEQRIGDWDKVAINFGYRQFAAAGEVDAALTKIIDDAWALDLRYFTNQDSDIHPRTEQWSNGVNQADELTRLMKVRRAALDRIGEKTIRTGAAMSTIEEPLVPIYMYHRYAVESTSSMLGGQDFVYAMRGDGRTPVKWETAANQRKALESLAATLKPSELTIPKKILDAIPPRPPGYGMHRELFPRTTGEAFDPVNPGTIAADVTIGFVLQADRASRLVAQNAVDPALPGLGEVIDRLTKATFDAVTASAYEAEVRRAAERVLVARVQWLAMSAPNGQVRAVASLKLQRLAARLRTAAAAKAEADQAQHTLLAADIKRFLERPSADPSKIVPASPAPPGAPIGDLGQNWLLAPPKCSWDDSNPGAWLFYGPGF
ncbi:MAG: zinc-dependent metalloprotease [Acidobacteria bacterium]|nr:zinc-dependent metalloprotease [Acidobacteriota bacterium]